MKTYFSLLSLFLLVSSFSVATPKSDEDEALQSIHEFYDAMSEFNYQKMGTYCTDQFALIDNAVYYNNLAAFVEEIKNYEGTKFEYKLDVHKTDFNSKTGLIILTFDIDFILEGEKTHITALESYVMKKEGGKWLISFAHSSPIEK